jgi:hypothetical protein
MAWRTTREVTAMNRTLLCVPLLLLAACATNPADDPLQVKLNDLDSRVGRVERVVSNQSLVDMSRRIDVLEAQLRELRGSVEVLQNGNEGLRKQQRDLYAAGGWYSGWHGGWRRGWHCLRRCDQCHCCRRTGDRWRRAGR